MKYDRCRAPQHYTDGEGRTCVRIPLAQPGLIAKTSRDAFEQLVALGLSHLWTFNYAGGRTWGYVRASAPGYRLLTIARLIAEAGKRQQVKYLDGDPMNLLPENLRVIAKGTAKTDSAALLHEWKARTTSDAHP